jgi:heat shock protein HslJ
MRSIVILALLAWFAACKTNKASVVPELVGGSEELYMYQWNLVELNSKPAAGATLLLSPGQVNRVAGNTSCNNMTGTMELKMDHAVKFNPLATTRKACMGENVEQPYLKALESATHWSIKDKQLFLLSGNTVVARFNAQDVSKSLPDEFKGNWELEYITGPRIAFEGLYPEKKPLLIYEAGDDYSGNTSCNGMGGKLVYDGQVLSFKPPITTMMACPGDGEQTFLKTLAMVDGYVMEEGKLVLRSKGVAVMRFAKK